LTKNIPVIFISAMGHVEDESQGFDAGGVDYILKPVSRPIVLRRVKTHLSLVHVTDLEGLVNAAIRMLGDAGHYNDTDTGAHIWRMANYASALSKALGWTDAQAKMMELAAPMHDTGKIGIPDAILKAPRKLDAQEWEVMKSHAQIGFDILSQSPNPVFSLAAEIALSHHERFDGNGYPHGLKGGDIPMSARIVAIADVFDALTMKRPYKEAWQVADAVDYIEDNAGGHFDPELVGLFRQIQPQLLEIKARWQ
jgi:putative two-component system response regulator